MKDDGAPAGSRTRIDDGDEPRARPAPAAAGSTSLAGAREAEGMLLEEHVAKLFRRWLQDQDAGTRELLERIYVGARPLPRLLPAEELRRVRALNRFRRAALAWLGGHDRSP